MQVLQVFLEYANSVFELNLVSQPKNNMMHLSCIIKFLYAEGPDNGAFMPWT